MTETDRVLLIYFCVVSVLALGVTVYDKIAAKRLPRHRVAERSLLALAAVGGAPMMLFVMALIRHKTKHFGIVLTVSLFTILYFTLLLAYVLLWR